MAVEVNLRRSKIQHKVLMQVLKLIPAISALCYFVNTVFNIYGIDLAILSFISGISLLPWLFILLASFVFKFCFYHRMFLYYILLIDVVNHYDFCVGIPISDIQMLILHCCIVFVVLMITLIIYVKYNKKAIVKHSG